jgi:hypothetical protein
MSQQVRAPFSSEQVESLNAYQMAGRFHEFTCGAGHVLRATPGGWLCDHCPAYRQDWCHAFMADWSWRRSAAGGPA